MQTDNLPIDDSDAKARRNVVVMSASILFAGYLDLKVPFLMNVLSLDAATDASRAGKIWHVVFLLLIYFVLRYHFCPERRERWRAGGEVLSGLHMKWLKPWLRREIARERTQARRKRDPNSIIEFDPDVFGIPWLRVDGWRCLGYQYRIEDELDEEFNRRYENDDYEEVKLPIWLALWNLVASLVVRLFLSRDGLEVALPYWLATVAAYVCFDKAGLIKYVAQWLG